MTSDRWTAGARTVPHVDTPGCCRTCFGATSGVAYDRCYRCARRWATHPEFAGACDLIVPCTIATEPSAWYSALWQYKTGSHGGSPAAALRSVLVTWLRHHMGRVRDALGGPVEVLTVVPSARQAMPTQLLRIVESLQPPPHVHVGAVAQFRRDTPLPPRRLIPDAIAVTAAVSGRRVLLIEDTWVSGSRALSTAIAIRRAGARTIALVPIARMVYLAQMTTAYADAASSPLALDSYPRA